MSEHRGLDHKGVERDCVQEWHFCGARDTGPKRYRTIVVDPPWRVGRGPEWSSNGPSRPLAYQTLHVQDIAALPIGDWAERDAHLYVWTINAYLEATYGLVRHWGFRPSTLLTWCKKSNGIGLGGAFSLTTEFVLFARRGTCKSLRRNDMTWWEWPRGRHSEKPAAFYDMVESMSPGPYLDVFARRHRFGWDCFGNEVFNPPGILETLTSEQSRGLVEG